MADAELANPSLRKHIGGDYYILARARPVDPWPGRAVLIDFGLASVPPKKILDGDMDARSWLAPEILLGARWSFKSDVWSVGLLVRESLMI